MYLSRKHITLSAILLIFLGNIFILSVNIDALSWHDPVDKNSVVDSLIPGVGKDLQHHITLAENHSFNGPPSFIKLNDPLGLFSTINWRLVKPLRKHQETQNICDVINNFREVLISRLTSGTSEPIKKKTDFKARLICNPKLLLDFYFHQEFQPVWVTQSGLNNKGKILLKTLHKADREGFDTRLYHLDDILTSLNDIESGKQMDMPIPEKFVELDLRLFVELDLRLTDAFFSYGYHLSEGIIKSYSKKLDWHIKKPKKNLEKILQAAVLNDKLEELVDMLQPRHPGYLRLRSALLKYQDIEKSGSWPKVPVGSKICKGDSGKRIAALRSRLIVSGDMPDLKENHWEYFDAALEDGVKRFQARNGLKVDGIVGSNTLSALNVSVENRIEQIKMNMERWRWLPQDLGMRYLMVNTANYELDIIENNRMIKSIRAIVGKKKRPTPMLSRKITYMVLNPYWDIPYKIATDEILPHIKKDPEFLADKGIRIFEKRKLDAREINPESIDWKTITKDNFSYKLRQDPMVLNALGRVKFIFPNEFSIYLHDTPYRNLFNMRKRTFSSGCIRIENPIEFAAYLLKENSKWNFEKLMAEVNSGKTRVIVLPNPIKIYILYWTAWVDKNGIVNFRDDIYGIDRRLNMALNRKVISPGILYAKYTGKTVFSSRFQSLSHLSGPHLSQNCNFSINGG